jgi:DnaJ domain
MGHKMDCLTKENCKAWMTVDGVTSGLYTAISTRLGAELERRDHTESMIHYTAHEVDDSVSLPSILLRPHRQQPQAQPPAQPQVQPPAQQTLVFENQECPGHTKSLLDYMPQKAKELWEKQSLTHYQVLDVPLHATTDETKKAYKEHIRSCHPDKAGRDKDDQ